MTTIKIETTKPKNFKQKKFPEGKNQSDYKECSSWTYREWAWEFLCRNIEFRKASDKVVTGTEKDRALVAKKYGLVKFKYYAEVQTKKSGYPTFKEGAIKCLENLGSKKVEETIGLYPGQIVIRFKLTAESNVQQSLDAQIKKAKAILKKKTDEFHKVRKQRFGTKNPKANLFCEYLRILDMQAHGLDTTQIFRHLNEFPVDFIAKKSNIEKLDNMKRDVHRYTETANECANELYLSNSVQNFPD